MARQVTMEDLRTSDPVVRVGSNTWGAGNLIKVLVRCRACRGLSLFNIASWARTVSGMKPCAHCGAPLRFIRPDIRRVPIIAPEAFRIEDYKAPAETAPEPAPEPAPAPKPVPTPIELETALGNVAAQVEALAELAATLEQRVAGIEAWVGRFVYSGLLSAKRWDALTTANGVENTAETATEKKGERREGTKA